ncbi:unnamed protein product [Closterium sp. Naga37s-1]|nr:unnamed protein product [Closterium sp. Naga37s-1]
MPRLGRKLLEASSGAHVDHVGGEEEEEEAGEVTDDGLDEAVRVLQSWKQVKEQMQQVRVLQGPEFWERMKAFNEHLKERNRRYGGLKMAGKPFVWKPKKPLKASANAGSSSGKGAKGALQAGGAHTLLDALLMHVLSPIACSFPNLMFFPQSHVLSPISCSFPNLMFFPQSHVLSPISCSFPNLMFFPQSHVLSPISCSFPNLMFFPQSHVLSPISCSFPNTSLACSFPNTSLSCSFPNTSLSCSFPNTSLACSFPNTSLACSFPNTSLACSFPNTSLSCSFPNTSRSWSFPNTSLSCRTCPHTLSSLPLSPS